MKKIILIMAVVVMAMVAIPAYAESQAQFWAKIRNSQNANRSHGHYSHGCQGRHGHGGVAAIEDLGVDANGDRKRMVVFNDGRVLIVCSNGDIKEGSDPRTLRKTLGIAGVLGALGILVGAH